MTVKFALGIPSTAMDDFLECVRLEDECGIAAIGVADSQSLWHELWSCCTLAAMNTKNVLIGPWVTNPVTLVGKFIPDDVAERVRQFISGYASVSHASPADENPNVKLMERLGLTDYFADRFAIAGTVHECAQQIKDLEPRGVSQFMVPVVVADNTSYVKQLGTR